MVWMNCFPTYVSCLYILLLLSEVLLFFHFLNFSEYANGFVISWKRLVESFQRYSKSVGSTYPLKIMKIIWSRNTRWKI